MKNTGLTHVLSCWGQKKLVRRSGSSNYLGTLPTLSQARNRLERNLLHLEKEREGAARIVRTSVGKPKEKCNGGTGFTITSMAPTRETLSVKTRLWLNEVADPLHLAKKGVKQKCPLQYSSMRRGSRCNSLHGPRSRGGGERNHLQHHGTDSI